MRTFCLATVLLAACGGEGGTKPVDWDDVTPFTDDEVAYMTYSEGEYDTISVVDTETGETRVVSDLDGGEGFGLSSVAMSPDRRSIAFSAYFRLEESDISPAGGLPHPGIWRVTDDEQYEMITPPLQQMDSGTACSSDVECAPLGMECNLVFGTCQLEAASFHTDDLAFSPDGDQLWFDYGTYWLDGYYLAGGSTLASVSSVYGETAAPEVHLDDSGCAQVTNPAVHPDGTTVTAIRSVCLDWGDEGLFDYDLPGVDGVTRAVPTPEGFDISLTSGDWYPDGSGFVFVVYGGWDEEGDGDVDWYADGLVQWTAATDEVTLISAMPEGFSIKDPTISPDGKKIAMCVTGAGSDLYVVDLDAWRQDPLTEHGASCKPSW